VQVPENLGWIARQPGGPDWIASLPDTVAHCRRTWALESIGAPYAAVNVSYVVPARRDGQDVVLKIQWPDRDCLHEADALSLWNGNGAVRLLAHDAAHHALLLERCTPGIHLPATVGIDQLAIASGLLARLLRPADAPFRHLAEEARNWESSLVESWHSAGQPCERALVDLALHHLQTLGPTQTELLLLNQDMHGNNIISRGDADWVVIDPKPLVGERAFSLAPLVRSSEFGHSRNAVLDRLDRLARELDVDRERARGWSIAQTMVWCFDSRFCDRNLETVRWLATA
jgi:streptomycin 6-kinase